MTFKNFLNLTVEKITEHFPQSKILYQQKTISETHFIQIFPQEVFDSDEFTDLYFEITDLFKEKEFDGDLCITSEDSLSDLDCPEILYNGQEQHSYKTSFAYIPYKSDFIGVMSKDSNILNYFPIDGQEQTYAFFALDEIKMSDVLFDGSCNNLTINEKTMLLNAA